MKRLLLVDDEQDLLDVLSDHFKGRYEIDTAQSGLAALDRFAQQRPDAVFLDVSMPGLDGIEVLRRLRRNDARVPVVMVTANADVKVTEAFLRAGAFGYVPKPFDFRYLDHMIATIFERPRR
jgi:DNA-binding response OmpR family regulator